MRFLLLNIACVLFFSSCQVIHYLTEPSPAEIQYQNTLDSLGYTPENQLLKLKIQYNKPVIVPKNYISICESTYEVSSILSIENKGFQSSATIFINPPIGNNHIYEIPADTTILLINNWKGSRLKVVNVSRDDIYVKLNLY